MKTIVKILPALLMALFVLGSCAEKEIEYNNGNVAAVEELIAPAGTETTLLENPEEPDKPENEFTFKWKTVESGVVRYSVAFSATATGEELLRITPADGAVNGSTKITYTTIDQIAYEAGIKAGEKGDLYWTVYTVRGNTEVKASAAPKKLPVERLAGLESPAHLFITGAATEGGTDIAAAQAFRNDAENVFVVYTELKAGQPFIFSDSNFGTGYESYSYSIDERKYIEGAGITPMTVETDGVYRVTANIRYNRYTIELIENLRLFYPAGIEVGGEMTHDFPMTYLGGGIWKLEDFRFEFIDNRYIFRVEVSGKPRVWGHSEFEVAAPPAVTGGAYYYINDSALGGDYDYAYKLMPALTGMTTDIYVDMSAVTPAPTHTFDLAKVDEVPPVAEFTAPAADASLDLNDTANFNVTFSWAEPTYDKAFPAKYEVVLFEDAAGETEITSVPAVNYGLDTETTIARNILDNAASVVGADIGGEGAIWWSVRTSMLDKSVMATPAPRKLNVTRITLPDQLYISGAATEQADVANALKMRKLEDGVFQGYYTFRNNAAGFRLTDGTSGEYATYAYVDGIFTPSASTATIPASVVAGVSGTDRQYRITVDFKTNTITTQIIRTVTIHIQGRGRNNTMNTYLGNGAWRRSNWSVGTGGDTRYYFRVSYSTTNPSTNGSAWAEKWGCSRVDTNPDPTTANLEGTYGGQAYYNVVEYIGSDNFRGPGAPANENDWHYAWKLVTGDGLTNTGNKTFTVYMNGGTGTGTTTGTITSELPFHTY